MWLKATKQCKNSVTGPELGCMHQLPHQQHIGNPCGQPSTQEKRKRTYSLMTKHFQNFSSKDKHTVSKIGNTVGQSKPVVLQKHQV